MMPTVRAPFDGAVQEKLVSPGAYLKENTPILTLMKTNPVRLRVDLPESAASVRTCGNDSYVHDRCRAREYIHRDCS